MIHICCIFTPLGKRKEILRFFPWQFHQAILAVLPTKLEKKGQKSKQVWHVQKKKNLKQANVISVLEIQAVNRKQDTK